MISAKECDICGKPICTTQDYIGFRTYTVYKMIFASGLKQYDVCFNCSEKIKDFIESIKEHSND